MEESTRGSSRLRRDMGMECLSGKMEKNIEETGKMGSSMGLGM
jgi:hypothetical protein